jgi:hypothetical protein
LWFCYIRIAKYSASAAIFIPDRQIVLGVEIMLLHGRDTGSSASIFGTVCNATLARRARHEIDRLEKMPETRPPSRSALAALAPAFSIKKKKSRRQT